MPTICPSAAPMLGNSASISSKAPMLDLPAGGPRITIVSKPCGGEHVINFHNIVKCLLACRGLYFRVRNIYPMTE
jgi:hypothetical protein